MLLTDTPEYGLLRLIARAELSPARADAFRKACDEVDWTEVIELATYHRLVPLLYVHVRDHASEVAPDDVQRLLRGGAMHRAMQVLFLSSELEVIATRFEEIGVPYLVLKGPSLAKAFGDASRRPFLDNDLLIRREDFGAVEKALREMGFLRWKRSQWQQAGYLYIHGEYSFGRAVGSQISTADVHVNLVPRGYAYRASFKDLRARSQPLQVAGVEVPVLSWEDLFIALSVNALKDQWNRLRLVSDLAELAKLVDWSRLMRLSSETHSRRAVQLAVLLAVDEIDADLPEAAVAWARADQRCANLAEHIRLHLRTFHEASVLDGKERIRLNLLAQDSVLSQVRYSSFVALRRVMEPLVATGTDTEVD